MYILTTKQEKTLVNSFKSSENSKALNAVIQIGNSCPESKVLRQSYFQYNTPYSDYVFGLLVFKILFFISGIHLNKSSNEGCSFI